MFYSLSKVLLLVVYGLALVSCVKTLPLPPDAIHWLRIVAVALLAAHMLEAVVFFKKVALYKGPLLDSVVLTVLFGFVHWMPLADAAQRGR
ncbi:DUF1145 domain-containing protein [Cupriavidus sp. BIS7]|uniref:DUF1145 domain-containing protein n=1 Tax=Cupriavidus sp. BIS7 TaxID=1217718 RepID=UPI0002E9DD0D|nr:DUF1145 domain-containing protein [Cupriavidus sp. BIS7]